MRLDFPHCADKVFVAMLNTIDASYSNKGLLRKSISTPDLTIAHRSRLANGYAVRPPRRALLDARNAVSSDFYQYVEKSQETLRSIYLRVLPGPLRWAPSFLVPTAAGLAIVGSVKAHLLLEVAQHLQVPRWLPILSELQYHYGKHTYFANVAIDTLAALIAALLVFAGLPAMDLILGQDPGTGQEDGYESAYKAMLQSHVGLYWLVLGAALQTCGTSDMHPFTILGMLSIFYQCISVCRRDPELIEITLAASVAMDGTMSILVAHELLHSGRKKDKLMASIALMPVAYMHWVPSHIAHHRKVATLHDPATARLGEPLYQYIPRSIIGNVKDGINAELLRLRAQGCSIWHPQNRIYQWATGPFSLLVASYLLWGPSAACLGIIQAILAIVLLEDVNYIEHYGLQRTISEAGRWEKVSVHHSWNANWLFTNSVTFSLQRHSDHHAHAHKPYHRLQDIKAAPQLPASYPVIMLLAFLPGLFFDVMDPRALAVARLDQDSD